MAKEKHDREDLMRDGTQMPIRGRRLIEGSEAFVGFRSSGQPSLYWNQDPVFQFDSQYALRRVFFDSERYLAVNGELMVLSEIREGDRLRFERSPINDARRKAIFGQLERCRQLIARSFIDDLAWEIVGDSVAAFKERTQSFLAGIDIPVQIASGPAAG